MSTIPAEVSLVVDSGFISELQARSMLNDFNGVEGTLTIRTIEGNIITMKILDYFIKYLDDEAC